MNSDDQRSALMLVAIKVIAQMGTLLVLIVGGSVGIGLLLDHLLGTRPIFIAVLILASVPVTLWTIYRYSLYQAKRISSSQKEEKISDL
jgi:F0F1-type ATP synthase assembly protein I